MPIRLHPGCNPCHPNRHTRSDPKTVPKISKFSRWTKQVSHTSKEIVGDVARVLAGYRQFKKSGTTE